MQRERATRRAGRGDFEEALFERQRRKGEAPVARHAVLRATCQRFNAPDNSL